MEVDRKFDLVLDFETQKVNLELLQKIEEIEADPFSVISCLIIANFDEANLNSDLSELRLFKSKVAKSRFILKFSSYEFKKAMRHHFSSDSLIRNYGGTLWEPIFSMEKFVLFKK